MHTNEEGVHEPDERWFRLIVAVENGETGKMETTSSDMAKQPGYVMLQHFHDDGSPMWPGDPDRHDAGAGDRIDYLVGRRA